MQQYAIFSEILLSPHRVVIYSSQILLYLWKPQDFRERFFSLRFLIQKITRQRHEKRILQYSQRICSLFSCLLMTLLSTFFREKQMHQFRRSSLPDVRRKSLLVPRYLQVHARKRLYPFKNIQHHYTQRWALLEQLLVDQIGSLQIREPYDFLTTKTPCKNKR